VLSVINSTSNQRLAVTRLVTLLVVVFGLLAGCSKDLSEKQYIERAKDLQDKGNLRGSVIELKNALRRNPDSLEGRWMLGNIYLDIGDGASAEKELKRAGKLGIPAATVRVPLARAYLFQGQFDRVIKELEQNADLSETNKARADVLRGQAYLGLGKTKEAADQFDAALAIKTDYDLALLGQAQLALMKERLDEARGLTQKVLTADPKSAEAWSLRGSIESAAGNYTESEAAFTKAVEFRKYATLDLAKRAAIRVKLKKYTEAEADLRKLKQEGFKDHPYVNFVAGIDYFKQGKYSDALSAFQASDNSLPSSLPTEIYLAATHFLLGHVEQAANYAGRVQTELPHSLMAKRMLVAIEMRRSEFDAAKSVLQEALHDSPNDAIILRMLANVSLLQGNTAEGVKYYEKLVSLDPESKQARDMLMVARLLTGQEQASGTAATGSDDYTRELILALEAFRRKNIGVALTRAQKLHDRYPDKVDPLNLIAACYLAAGKEDKAKVEFEKVLKISPTNPSASKNLAKIEARTGDLGRARDLLKALLKESPGDEEAIILLAEADFKAGNQTDGDRLLEDALEKNPQSTRLRAKLTGEYFRTGRLAKVLEATQGLDDKQVKEQPALLELRGKAQMLTGDPSLAKDTFQRWSKLIPGSAQAHFLYGDSLARSGDKEQARQQLERALRLQPDYLPARVAEVRMQLEAGKIDDARKAVANLRKDFGERADVLSIEGLLALAVHDFAAAADRFAAVAKQRPNTEVTLYLVNALWAQQHYDQALRTMQDWLKDHPQDLAVLLQLAGGYLSLDKEDKARTTYAKVIKYYPDHVPALNNLAWLNRDTDLKSAISYAEHANQVAPQDPQVMDTLGMLLLKKGDTDRADRLIRDAAQRSPDDPGIQVHLGRILVEQKQYAEAKKILDAVIKKAPETKNGDEARALLKSIP